MRKLFLRGILILIIILYVPVIISSLQGVFNIKDDKIAQEEHRPSPELEKKIDDVAAKASSAVVNFLFAPFKKINSTIRMNDESFDGNDLMEEVNKARENISVGKP